MAATVSAWAKPGAWALDSEENEAIETLHHHQHKGSESNGGLDSAPPSDFPSLSAAAATKTSKKKKSQTLSLAEFTTGKPVTHGAAKFQARGPAAAHEEPLLLPTGPRERTAEELERSSSRGFNYSSYGGGARRSNGGEDSSSRWGSSRVSDEPRRGNSGNGGSTGFERDSGPSRADEIDDWGAAKKSVVPLTERRERTGGFFDSQSKADESESWISNKTSVLPPSDGRRGGSGYRERRGGFEMYNREGLNDGSGMDSDTWGRKREEATGGRPRLLLQPRSLPLENGNGEHHGEQQGTATKSKGSNPFGEARPREDVLAEKGQDWKKIDEQLESMKIREMGHKPGEGLPFGKKSFGAGNGQGSLPEERTDMNWRKADSTDAHTASPRAEKVEEGALSN